MNNTPATYVVVDGIRWDLFSASYRHQDSEFSFYFYAKNREHAEEMLKDIRSGAKLEDGQIVGFSAHEPTQQEMEACEIPPIFH